jgi:long-chain acyl-CoA synthetase
MAEVSTGLVSGARRLSPDALDARVRRIATGLAALGVAPGQCVAILMRNDIAFMEAAYAAQTLGAYAVPINWHFKAEEIAYILADCGTRVLIGHVDLLSPVAADIPTHVTLIAVPTPPEVAMASRPCPPAPCRAQSITSLGCSGSRLIPARC